MPILFCLCYKDTWNHKATSLLFLGFLNNISRYCYFFHIPLLSGRTQKKTDICWSSSISHGSSLIYCLLFFFFLQSNLLWWRRDMAFFLPRYVRLPGFNGSPLSVDKMWLFFSVFSLHVDLVRWLYKSSLV